jgi:ATP-dependent Clp protease ATP-binding subunit ClpA
MYERFTDRSRKAMQLAQQEAQRFNHEQVDTGHVLIGLAKEGSGVAAAVMKNLGMDLDAARLAVEKLLPAGSADASVLMGRLPQTGAAKAAVAFAIREAKELGHNYIGTEHLLLGLLHGEGHAAVKALAECGVKIETVREEIHLLLGTAGKGDIWQRVREAIQQHDRPRRTILGDAHQAAVCLAACLQQLIDRGEDVATWGVPVTVHVSPGPIPDDLRE